MRIGTLVGVFAVAAAVIALVLFLPQQAAELAYLTPH